MLGKAVVLHEAADCVLVSDWVFFLFINATYLSPSLFFTAEAFTKCTGK